MGHSSSDVLNLIFKDPILMVRSLSCIYKYYVNSITIDCYRIRKSVYDSGQKLIDIAN